MKYKKIILGVALALACFSSLNANALTETKVKKTETQTAAPNVYWTDGYGRVSYTTNSIISPVVKIALKEFAGDMKAVTGFDAKEKSGAPIQIYQLDQLTNKEFSAVEKLGAPLHLIITAKDAFYIGTRKGKLIVIGSNARGTAYAIMKLSELAGVSPLAAWNDLQPAQRKSLYTPVDQQWIEVPRIEFRGLALNNSQWMKPQNYSRIARLMLRLRANTLWQARGCLQQGCGRQFRHLRGGKLQGDGVRGQEAQEETPQNHRECEASMLGCTDGDEQSLAGPAARNAQQQGLSGEQECPARQIAPLCRPQRRRLCLDSQHYQSEAVNLPASHDDEPGVE